MTPVALRSTRAATQFSVRLNEGRGRPFVITDIRRTIRVFVIVGTAKLIESKENSTHDGCLRHTKLRNLQPTVKSVCMTVIVHVIN